MRTRHISCLLLVLPLLSVLPACSGSGATSGTSRNQNVITMEEIRAEVQATNLYDVIYSLRPNWLRPRSTDSMSGETQIWVYVDGMQYGGVESLRQMAAEDAGTLRFLNGSAATLRFGQNHTQGVIEVTTRR